MEACCGIDRRCDITGQSVNAPFENLQLMTGAVVLGKGQASFEQAVLTSSDGRLYDGGGALRCSSAVLLPVGSLVLALPHELEFPERASGKVSASGCSIMRSMKVSDGATISEQHLGNDLGT
mmetsp:Transcript_101452/g.264552  ORF Transcript_101452/g.264552 Transcript_101452/m.264552 type:complete len:122 (+) Transcript_101452:437-802(+)